MYPNVALAANLKCFSYAYRGGTGKTHVVSEVIEIVEDGRALSSSSPAQAAPITDLTSGLAGFR